jgi:hypothetical protein
VSWVDTFTVKPAWKIKTLHDAAAAAADNVPGAQTLLPATLSSLFINWLTSRRGTPYLQALHNGGGQRLALHPLRLLALDPGVLKGPSS